MENFNDLQQELDEEIKNEVENFNEAAQLPQMKFRDRLEDVVAKAATLEHVAVKMQEAARQLLAAARSTMREIE